MNCLGVLIWVNDMGVPAAWASAMARACSWASGDKGSDKEEASPGPCAFSEGSSNGTADAAL